MATSTSLSKGTNPFRREKALIAVMGATGSGKSSLIGAITGRDDIVGHALESETSSVEPYEITIGCTTLVLVDTPGFDDTNMSDFEILQTIATWLEATFEKGQLLSGIIYLHRITNTRVAGSARRALHLFQRICGEDNYKNVILATTFWNCIAHCEEIGVDREHQLLSNEGFWKCMKEKGAQTTRLTRDYKTVLPALIEMAAKPKVTLEIQHELNDGCSLERTMAGLFINDDVAHLEREHERKTAKIQEDFNKRLQEQQGRRDAARRMAGQTALTNLANKEKSDQLVLDRQRQAMQQQIEAFRLNQRVKEAEVAAKLRADEALEAERVRVREQEEARARQKAQRKAAERESEQRYAQSSSQRRQVDQQLQVLRTASLAGFSSVSVPGVRAGGLGMGAGEGPQQWSVMRTGLNEWCDFCLEPFGIGQRVEDALIKTTYYLSKTLTDKGRTSVAAYSTLRVSFATEYSAEGLWKGFIYTAAYVIKMILTSA